eukprot:1768353-Prymnesium_polylepis.1
MALPPFIHAVVIRSCSVPQLCAAEFRGAHVGAGGWGHAHRLPPAGRCEVDLSSTRGPKHP